MICDLKRVDDECMSESVCLYDDCISISDFRVFVHECV